MAQNGLPRRLSISGPLSGGRQARRASEIAFSTERQDVKNGDRSADDALHSYANLMQIVLAVAKFKKLLSRSVEGAPGRVSTLKCRAPKCEWNDLKVGIELGKGAYGVAYEVTLPNGEQAAVKILQRATCKLALAIADMQSESVLLSQLRHEHCMRALFVGQHPTAGLFIVTPRLMSTLSSELPRAPDEVGVCTRASEVKAWPLVRAVRCGVQIGAALRYCHHEVMPGSVLMHRDLKPDNVGLMPNGDAMLFDFGLSKIASNDGALGPKHTGQTGSLRYMAPEVALDQCYNHKADVYSFAVILWQMAAHTVPYLGLGGQDGFVERVARGGLRPPLNPKWPPLLRDTLSGCWAADQQERSSLQTEMPRLEALLRQVEEEWEERKERSERSMSRRLSLKSPRRSSGTKPRSPEPSADPATVQVEVVG